MAILVDTSAIIAVTANEPTKPRLITLTMGQELVAATTLPYEVGNAVSAMFKQKRITLDEGLELISQYRRITVRLLDVDMEESVKLASILKIYAYDAYIIQCAKAQGHKLLTLDGGLKQAAKAAGVEVLEVT